MADVEAAIPPGSQLPLTVEQVQEWRGRIQLAKDKRHKISQDAGWARRIESYLGRPLGTNPIRDTIVVPKDYANVEQKKAQLFSQLPEIHLAPSRDEFAQAAPIAQAVLREYLGPRHIHAEAVMDETLFDALCPAGLLCSKIGYESVQDGRRPIAGPPTPDPMTGAMIPGPPQLVPNTIWERYFWERISPLKILIPADFQGSDYDRAAWLGFEMDIDADKIQGGVTNADRSDDDQTLNVGENQSSIRNQQTPTQHVIEIWLRASLFDPTCKNPDQFRYLCLIDGQDVPKRYEDSPYQTKQLDGTLGGMKRNPIRIGALRYVSDSAYPPSDCAMSTPQVEELSKGRTQMIQQRDRNLPVNWVDRNRVDKDDVEKINRGEIQSIVPVDGNGAEIFGELRKATMARENFEFNEIIDRDLSETWALGANQRGAVTPTDRTATELSLIQNNTDVRLRRERAKVMAYYTAAAEDILALIQQFADDQDFVRIVGADGIASLTAWNKDTIAGDFAFTAIPDSSVYQDQAARRQHATQVYQFLAANPQANQQEILSWYLQENDLPPAKFLAPPQPPKPKEPSVSFAFKGEDLNPMMPQAPIVMEIMQQAGIQVSPGAVQAAQAQAQLVSAAQQMQAEQQAMDQQQKEHGPPPQQVQTGVAPQQAPLNKHVSELTGRNTAGLAPGVQ